MRLRAAALAAAVAAAAGAGCGGGHKPVEPLPATICSPVVRGQDKPDLLVVSDLPLRGAMRHTTVAMARAIQYEIARHGYRAGRYAIGFQSCDDSSAERGNFTPARCAANMKAYAANPDVVAVIGPFNSQCAQFQIPLANRAPDGPLAMLSPSNTLQGLTHGGAGVASGEPGRYYPTGKRNYARLAPADDAEAAALVLLARRLGARRVALVEDQELFSAEFSRLLVAAARRAGLRLAPPLTWDPHGAAFGALARRVARESPEAVLVSGLWQDAGVPLLTALRAALPAGTPLLAFDGFASLPTDLVDDVAGLRVAVAGLPETRLRPHGHEVVRRFGFGQLPGFGPPYAAQAAEVILAAIARSDGSRASVTRNLFGLRMRGSVLGPIAFDASGDIVLKPVAIYRAGRQGLALEQVITPPARLVGCPPRRDAPAAAC